MFLTFEGLDGSGKTTQVRRLAERLRGEGLQPLVVREPGGTALSERVRTLLLEAEGEVVPMAELLLFSAARAQLVAEKIRPALAEGRPVLCDRFYDSTTAYQGAGRALAPSPSPASTSKEQGAVEAGDGEASWLDDFHHRVTGGLTPDRTYLLHLSPAAARQRRQAVQRRDASVPDRMEAGPAAFYQRVAAAYDALAARHPHRICTLDATQPPDVLHEALWRDVEALRSG